MIKAKNEEFWKYLDSIYSTVDFEVVDVFLLDSESRIFSSCRIADGDVNHVQFYPPTLSRILLETSPAGIIIVHNHPQGTSTPSAADREMTEKCQVLCSLHNVMFCDHIIYAQGQFFSFYDSGNLQDISMDYSIENLVRKKGAPYDEC
jgi:DNA repair protein RadC